MYNWSLIWTRSPIWTYQFWRRLNSDRRFEPNTMLLAIQFYFLICYSTLRELKLVAENRKDHATPVVCRCHNRRCKKCSEYISIRDGTIFQDSHPSLDMILHLIVLYANNVRLYKQISLECIDEQDVAVAYQDGLPICRQSPIQVLTRLCIE